MTHLASPDEDERVVVSVCTMDGRAVLAATGEIDLTNAHQLRRHLLRTVRDGHRRVVVDLTHVTYLDSTGLGVLVAARKRLRAHAGTLHLVAQRESVLRLFAITHLDAVFRIHRTLGDALGAGD